MKFWGIAESHRAPRTEPLYATATAASASRRPSPALIQLLGAQRSRDPRIGGNSAVTLEILVGLVEQVSVDVGASPCIPTDRTQSLHAHSGHGTARPLSSGTGRAQFEPNEQGRPRSGSRVPKASRCVVVERGLWIGQVGRGSCRWTLGTYLSKWDPCRAASPSSDVGSARVDSRGASLVEAQPLLRCQRAEGKAACLDHGRIGWALCGWHLGAGTMSPVRGRWRRRACTLDCADRGR